MAPSVPRRPAAPGTVERLLDRAGHRDWYAGLRIAPPAARALLDVTRPEREIGTDFPPSVDQVTMLRPADLVVHLHGIRPSRALPRCGGRLGVPGCAGAEQARQGQGARPEEDQEQEPPAEQHR
jgi:hypothetical protein